MFSNILSFNGKSDHDVMSHSVKQALKIAQIAFDHPATQVRVAPS